VRSTVGISLLRFGSLNVANNLLDLLVGFAALDLRPNVFCLTQAVVGFPACETHDELVIQSLFTRGICVKMYLLTTVWFPLGDARVCTEGVGVILHLLVEAGCICNIKQLEITHIYIFVIKKKLLIPTIRAVDACLFLGLEIGYSGTDDCVGCESSGTG
jgi:hypothetical protein